MANNCHKVTLATGMDLQDSKAILGIVEGDALDRTREGFQGRFLFSLCGSEHLVHGACWVEFPASLILSRDCMADEVALLRSHSLRPSLPVPESRSALSKLEGNDRRSKRDLTLMYVLCLFFSRHRSREATRP